MLLGAATFAIQPPQAAQTLTSVRPTTDCRSITPEVTSEWCALACGISEATCPGEQCCCASNGGCTGRVSNSSSVAGPSASSASSDLATNVSGPGPSAAVSGNGTSVCVPLTELSAAQLRCTFPELGQEEANSFADIASQLLGTSLSTTCGWRNFLGIVGAETGGLSQLSQQRMAQQADERFIGRGPLQLAGLANYRYCAALGSCRCADIVEHPELVASDPVIGFSTARCIWTQLFGHDLGSHADGTEEGFRASSCYVKQGSAACRHSDWEDRVAHWRRAERCIGTPVVSSGSQQEASSLAARAAASLVRSPSRTRARRHSRRAHGPAVRDVPECKWLPKGNCSIVRPFECTSGRQEGVCNESNWAGMDPAESQCEGSCVHLSLFADSPTSTQWLTGYALGERRRNRTAPHYEHNASLLHQQNGLFGTYSTSASAACRKPPGNGSDGGFVGISLYSPKYQDKATRLLASCARFSLCCRVTGVPANAFGPDILEGSDSFRYRFISMKPIFMVRQLQKLNKPVAWLDVDMEFRAFPRLFTPSSWPGGTRDMCIFNFRGNQSDTTYVSTASGVVFINNTARGKALLQAWAEATAWPGNEQAPDDQVLDKLLNEGGWLHRASLGWLPAAYLRHLPNYYRGVDPGIDHDKGNPDGVLGHSTKLPQLPPTSGNYTLL